MASRTSTTNRSIGDAPRRHRYTRASTTSVTQLLSDSCSSLLNRLTKRGPSEKTDRNANLSTFVPTVKPRYDDFKLFNTRKNSVLNSVKRYEDRSYDHDGLSYGSSLHRVDEKAPALSYGNISRSRQDVTPIRTFASTKSRTEESRPLLSTFVNNKSKSRVDDSPPVSSSRQPLREHDLNRNNIVHSTSSTVLGSTRSRLEDKYSAVLDKVANRKKELEKKDNDDRERTIEPSISRSIVKSITNAVFGDKSHPYVSAVTPRDKTRDKTPFKHNVDKKASIHRSYVDDHKQHHDHRDNNSSLYSYDRHGKDRDSAYRTKTKSNHENRRISRTGKSETSERLAQMRLCPVNIDDESINGRRMAAPLSTSASCALVGSTRPNNKQERAFHEDDDETTPIADPAVIERENRRKEIQSLIMKYSALDEVYGRVGETSNRGPPPTTAPAPASTKQALAPTSSSTSRPRTRPKHCNAATPPVSARPKHAAPTRPQRGLRHQSRCRRRLLTPPAHLLPPPAFSELTTVCVTASDVSNGGRYDDALGINRLTTDAGKTVNNRFSAFSIARRSKPI